EALWLLLDMLYRELTGLTLPQHLAKRGLTFTPAQRRCGVDRRRHIEWRSRRGRRHRHALGAGGAVAGGAGEERRGERDRVAPGRHEERSHRCHFYAIRWKHALDVAESQG